MPLPRPAILVVASLLSLPSWAQAKRVVYSGMMGTKTAAGAAAVRTPIELQLPAGFERLTVGSTLPVKSTQPKQGGGGPFSFTIHGEVTGSDTHANGEKSVTVRFSGPRYHAEVQRTFDDLARSLGVASAKVRGGETTQTFRLRTDQLLHVSGRSTLEVDDVRMESEMEGLLARLQ
jgi:hypothetical protein